MITNIDNWNNINKNKEMFEIQKLKCMRYFQLHVYCTY